MKINDVGCELIKHFEGCKLEAYVCPAGKLTIGVGHTGDVKAGDRITLHQAMVILDHDLETFESIVTGAVRVPLNENQFSALVAFAFNVGPGKKGVRDGFVTLKSGEPSGLLRHVNAGEFGAAAEEFPKWVHGGGGVLPGLVSRRAAEQALFETKP